MRILQTKTYSRDLTAMRTPLPLTADAPALAGALKSRGYLKIHCPAQVAAALHRVFVEADAFFALPLPVKDRASLVDLFEGYRRLGSEYCESADRPDLAQSFWTHAFNLKESGGGWTGSLGRYMTACSRRLRCWTRSSATSSSSSSVTIGAAAPIGHSSGPTWVLIFS
jgi:hypothetical protein